MDQIDSGLSDVLSVECVLRCHVRATPSLFWWSPKPRSGSYAARHPRPFSRSWTLLVSLLSLSPSVRVPVPTYAFVAVSPFLHPSLSPLSPPTPTPLLLTRMGSAQARKTPTTRTAFEKHGSILPRRAPEKLPPSPPGHRLLLACLPYRLPQAQRYPYP